MNIKISKGNSKLGAIPSISLPAGTTCRNDCECSVKCYAKKIENLRPVVRNAYEHNYSILQNEPDTYWREVEASIMMSRFFRFHVSGDITDTDYLEHMIFIAERNPHCEILCFTKKYNILNSCIKKRIMSKFSGKDSLHKNYTDVLPNNLHLIMSGWRGLDMDNPYLLPEAHVRYRDGTTTAKESAVECNGNCTECALTECGCWNLKLGEQVVFNEH